MKRVLEWGTYDRKNHTGDVNNSSSLLNAERSREPPLPPLERPMLEL